MVTTPKQYMSGPANLARVQKDGENWPIGRIVGPETMQFKGWQRLKAGYARQIDACN
jgi:hypothetical protein